MRVLSLFDGISCAHVALERAGIHVDEYYASEVDAHAIKITQKKYPDTIQVGDINYLLAGKILDMGKIDLIVGGSPCQGFSYAGKQLAFDDPRSKLFFEFVRVLNYARGVNPNIKFLLENVSMKQSNRDIITEFMGVEPIMINSALVSAQNRRRLYWTNIPDVTQPADKGILLHHILESGVVDRDKSYCIDANYAKGVNVDYYIAKARRQIVFEAAAFTERRTSEAKRIRREYREKYGRDFSPRREKQMVLRDDGKMNCLTATYSMKEHVILDEKINYRKLTPIECERLQTLPDNYTEGISNNQRYKALGNGFTVDVIAHIMKGLT